MAFTKECYFCQTKNTKVEKGKDPHDNEQLVVECKKCLLRMDVTDEHNKPKADKADEAADNN